MLDSQLSAQHLATERCLTDMAIAHELARQKSQKISEEKLRQKLREGSQELRALEAKLRNAYIAKQQLIQIADKKARICDEMAKEAAYTHLMELEQRPCRTKSEQDELHRKTRQLQLKAQLDAQLNERADIRRFAYEERLRDKAMVEETTRRVHEADKKEREKKAMVRQLLKEDMIQQRAVQKALRICEHEKNIKAEQMATEYVSTKDAKDERIKQENKAHLLASQSVQENLRTALQEREVRARELENARERLLLNEKEQEFQESQRESVQRKLAIQKQMQQDYNEYLKGKQQKAGLESTVQRRMGQLLKLQMQQENMRADYEKEKCEQLKKENASAMRNALREKEQRMEMESSIVSKQLADLEQWSNRENRIVEEERERILMTHVPKLGEHLPKGIFLNREEMEKTMGRS
ncbi:unnamed protein product [Dicrocoelium dendriticum]|nr:unnamed protein product [Dicrocoelium dendriticum]